VLYDSFAITFNVPINILAFKNFFMHFIKATPGYLISTVNVQEYLLDTFVTRATILLEAAL